MGKELISNYLKVDSRRNQLVMYRDEPRADPFSTLLKDAVITFTEDGTVRVNGDMVQWGFNLHKTFVEDLEEKPNKQYTRLGYKNIIDFFKGVQKRYVKSGWYELYRTEKFDCEMSQWFIVFD